MAKHEHRYWLVTGHYCPTDANPETDAEEDVTTAIFDKKKDAKSMLLWYPDGEMVKVEKHTSEDSGGSTYLCSCTGTFNGRHKESCGFPNLFRPV